MIEVKGNDVKVGNATGEELIEEVTKAIYGVYLVLKAAKREGFSDKAVMTTLLMIIGRKLARMDKHYETKILDGELEDPEDFMKKVFGDLFD